MKILQKIIKLFAFIIIIKASFLLSFAFVGDDLGTDLYKNIDSGISKLNSSMYSYELKGGKGGKDISTNLNNFLQSKNIKGCSFKGIGENDFEEIKNGNISLLAQKVDKECSKNLDLLNQISNLVSEYSFKSKKIAKQKSKDIYNISRVGLFSNGSLDDSPFDIVSDIKDIDRIIFTQDIPYEGVESSDDNKLKDYLNGKLNNLNNKLKNLENKINGIKEGGEFLKNNNENNILDNNGNIGNNNGNSNGNNNGGNIQNNDIKYICPIDESGLSDVDLYNLKNKNNDLNNYGPINSNYKPDLSGLTNPFSYSIGNNNGLGFGQATSNIGKKVYNEVNDNNFFGGCKSFFCIKIEMITHNANLLMGGKTMSIQAIMERSNKHLKKFVNSSLAQSKMTTNNFEMGTMIENLSDMFSMNIIITKRPVPMLKLNFSEKSEEEKHKDDPFALNNLLMQRFKVFGLDYKRENDLSIFKDNDYEIKNIQTNTELGVDKYRKLYKQRQNQLQKITQLDDHITKVILENPKQDNTDGLYMEFIELERFSHQIHNYALEISKASDKMLDIPIHK